MSFDFYMDAEEEWCYDTNPICDFPNLKKRLTDMGIQIGQANAWRSVGTVDRKSTRLNSSHANESRMPSSA